jgi:tetratricopeptide (TPR) repeat protein
VDRPRIGVLARLFLAAVLLVAVIVVRQQTLRMDWIFFQSSWAGAKGLGLYLAGDYGNAARAYRVHFRRRAAEHGGFGDPVFGALLAGDLDGAERAAKAALGRGWSADAHLTLGEVALHRGRPRDAVDAFGAVLERDPNHVDGLLLASVAYTQVGDVERAITALNRALRQGVGSRITGFLWILEATGDVERRSFDQRPLCLLAHWYRYLRVYDPANAKWAIARAEEAIARGDRPAEAYLTIGIVHQRQGRPDQALQALEQATRHDPHLAQAAWLLATISAERGDLARSYRAIRTAVEAGPVDPFYLDDVHGILAYRLSDLPADVEIMSRVLGASPDNLQAHRHLAYSTAVLGDEPRALIHYRRAVELGPNDPTNWEGVGWTLARLGRDEESIAAYRRAAALAPYRHEPHEAIARLHERKRRYGDAIVEYENAIRLGDRTVNTHLWLCVARYNVSEFEGATQCFREVLAREPGNATAQRYLPQSDHNARLQRGGR